MKATTPLWTDDELGRLFDWMKQFMSGTERPRRRGATAVPFDLARQQAVRQFLLMVAVEAARQRKTKWLPSLLEQTDLMDSLDDYEGSPTDICAEVAETLLACGAPVTRSVESMARAADARFRRAVAEGVRGTDPRAAPLLRQLATDAERSVRKPAQEKLAALQEIHWWWGMFDRNPLASLAPEQAERLGPAVQHIVTYLNQPSYERKKGDPEFVAAVARLPDDAAAAVIQRLAVTETHSLDLPPLLSTFIARPIAAGVLWKLLRQDYSDDTRNQPAMWLIISLPKWLETAEIKDRQALMVTWAERLVQEPPEEKSYESSGGSVLSLLPRLYAPGISARPFLELAERLAARAQEEGGLKDPVLNVLSCLLDVIRHDREVVKSEFGRLLEILHLHSDFGWHLDGLVRALDPAGQRAFAVKYQQSAEEHFRKLAQKITKEQAEETPEEPGTDAT